MLDISDINKVRILIEEGSFNKAAPKLFMSQPALTKKIARLEDRLGMTLFHRSNKGIIPTEFGKKIVADGVNISQQMDILERELILMAGKELGTLRLGVGPVIEEKILPQILGDFLTKYPNIGFDIKVDNANNLMKLLNEGEIDMAVGAFSNAHKFPEFHRETLGRRDVVFVARPEHPIFSKGASGMNIQKILEYPLAVPEIPPVIETWFKTQKQVFLNKDTYLLSENYRLLISVAKTTNHVIAGPDILFSEDLETSDLRIIPLNELPVWEAYIVMRPEAIHAPLVQSLLAMIKGKFSKLHEAIQKSIEMGILADNITMETKSNPLD